MSVQSISYRNAMFKPIMADRPGFRMEEIMCDIVHPNALGHRFAHSANATPFTHPYNQPCILGRHIYNEMQWQLLSRHRLRFAAFCVMLPPFCRRADLLLLVAVDDRRYFADLAIGYMQQVLADMLLESTDTKAPLPKLPPPLFHGNDVLGSAVCLKGEDLKTAVVNIRVRTPISLNLNVIHTIR